MEYVCYLLMNDDYSLSYIGITNNLERRLRQHNGEIKGGAKYTRKSKWNVICYIQNFPTMKDSLQFEWFWKYISRKFNSKNIIQKRINALVKIDRIAKTTKTSTSFNLYPKKLELVIVDNFVSIYIDMFNINFNNFDII